MKKRKTITLISSAIFMALHGTAAISQSAPPERDSQESTRRQQLEEITVTAQRRSQNVLDVPLSITAIPASVLQSTGVESMTDLRFNTPGFLTSTGSGYVQIFMRGIGNRIQIGADPSVTTFVDDTPRIYSSLVDDFSSVDRVEILKGAQGGLYGRNATAGVINIVTRQPDTEQFSGEVKLGYGSKETVNGSAYLNIPITDRIAMNFNISHKEHDSYLSNRAIRNPYSTYAALSPDAAAALGDTGQRDFLLANPGVAAMLDAPSGSGKMADREHTYADGKILFDGDRYQLTLAADWSETEDTLATTWKSVQLERTYATYGSLMGSFGLSDAQLPYDYLYQGKSSYGKFEAASSMNGYNKLEDYGASVKLDIDFNHFTLTSISSVRWNKSDFMNDVTGSAVPNAGFAAMFDRENFYQELRVVSTSDSRFRWLAGATYFDEKIDNYVQSILLGNRLAPTTNETGTEGFSYYIQGEYDLTNRLSITASGRYIDEEKYADFPSDIVAVYDPVTDMVMNNVAVSGASHDFNTTKFLPSLTVSYSLDAGGTVYARWAKGLKTGGANPMVHPAQTLGELNGLAPEEVDTYELGLRTTLLDGRAQFTSAIFYNDYRDLQVIKSGYAGLAGVYFNAGKAETYGAEASFNIQLTDSLNLTASAGYLEAEYKSFSSPGITDLKVAPFDVSGNRMILSPEWQASIILDYERPLIEGINAVGTVLYSYVSEFYTDDLNISDTAQDGYSVVNLRLGARSTDDRYGVYLSVNNLFNKEYVTWGSAAPSAYSVQVGAPRIIKGEIEFRF